MVYQSIIHHPIWVDSIAVMVQQPELRDGTEQSPIHPLSELLLQDSHPLLQLHKVRVEVVPLQLHWQTRIEISIHPLLLHQSTRIDLQSGIGRDLSMLSSQSKLPLLLDLKIILKLQWKKVHSLSLLVVDV